MQRIAVFTKNGELVPFSQCNTVEYYQKEETWINYKTESFPCVAATTVKGLREEMKGIVSMLEGIGVVACKEILGIPFTELDAKGKCIFAIENKSEDTFQGMLTDMIASDEKKRLHDEIIKNACPVQTKTPGVYFLDLVLLQKECPEVSSKRALKDFLATTTFMELKMLCAHIPPWLEHDTRYEIESKNENGVVSVTLTKSRC